jgi:hypothetical protein
MQVSKYKDFDDFHVLIYQLIKAQINLKLQRNECYTFEQIDSSKPKTARKATWTFIGSLFF